MKENVTNLNKGSDEQSPYVQILDHILVVEPREGDTFSGRLKRIQNNHLIFEKRNGAIVVIDEEAILSAFEVKQSRRL